MFGGACLIGAIALWLRRMTSVRVRAASRWMNSNILGMSVFLFFLFTRLVHIWSALLGYLFRAYQIVRTKRRQTMR